jgi:hypothetical protein
MGPRKEAIVSQTAKNKRSLLFSQRCEAIADFDDNRQEALASRRDTGAGASATHREPDTNAQRAFGGHAAAGAGLLIY